MKENKKDLSIGVAFLSIILITLGIFTFISLFNQFNFPSLFWAILYILSGVGLLIRKFWGFRLAQITFILQIIIAPFTIFLALYHFNEESIVLFISALILIGISVGLLYYLSRPKNVKQFLETANNERIKEKTSITPIFSIIFFLISAIGQLILFGIIVSYLFNWIGNWAYLIIIGGVIGIPFLSLIFGIILIAPIFLIIFWLITGNFPFWILFIWVVSFASQLLYGYLSTD